MISPAPMVLPARPTTEVPVLEVTVRTASTVTPVTTKDWTSVRPVGGERPLLSEKASSLRVTETAPGTKVPERRYR